MFDTLGTITLTTVFAVLVGTLVGNAAVGARNKMRLFGLAALWGVATVALAAGGAFAPTATGPVPAPLLAFGAATAVLIGLFAGSPGFREALLGLPLSVLVGLNVARVFGFFFLLLYATGRLSAPFAQSAGYGDVLVSGFAAVLAIRLATRGDRATTMVAIWNAFGALDLLAALILAALSSPGTPFRLFTEGAGTEAMTTLPWALIPTLLVPLYLLVHLAIAVKVSHAGLPRHASLPGAGAAA